MYKPRDQVGVGGGSLRPRAWEKPPPGVVSMQRRLQQDSTELACDPGGAMPTKKIGAV